MSRLLSVLGAFALALLLSLAGAPNLAAQSVRGQLVDKTNGTAISGAFVVLVDQGGQEIARALTGDAGTFLLHAPAPGTYRLQSKRIGFHVAISPPVALAAGQLLVYRLVVEAIPVELPTVVVKGRPQCGMRGEAGTVVAQLWEDAREALAAVRWTDSQRRYDMAIDLYERDVSEQGRVRDERSWSKRGSWETPFRGIPAESLAAVGYVVGSDRSGYTFYGPDPDVLLSDSFLETHCFSAHGGGGADSGFVGLAFEPAPDRRLPDIRGVLWLSRRTAELRNVEFMYVNSPVRAPGGGNEAFMRLHTGAWVIVRWQIRVPHLRESLDVRGRYSSVLEYHETGGHMSAVRSSTGELVYSADQAILDGVVVDSTRGGTPLAGAAVRLAGTPYTARADSGGHFRLSVPVDGTYGVVLTHPRLDSLGGMMPAKPVTLARGTRTTATVAVPPESELIRELCPEGVAENKLVIVGVVRSGRRDAPVVLAAVQASWQAPDSLNGVVTWTASATADSGGRYTLCGVPATRLIVRADSDGMTSHSVVLHFEADGVRIDERTFHRFVGRIWMADLTLQP